MRSFKRAILLGVAIASVSGVSFADTSSKDSGSDMDSVKAEIAQLRAANAEMKQQVAELKAAEGDNWLNQQRADQVKQVVRDVLADAETRASLQGSGTLAGYDSKKGGFFINSEDGKFQIRAGALFQLRYAADIRQNPGAAIASNVPGNAGPYDFTSGFEIRRFEPAFRGYIGDPHLEYAFVLQADRGSNVVTLKEAYAKYEIADGLTVQAGRYKPMFSHEEAVGSEKQLSAERSTVNNYFSIGHSEGAQFAYQADIWRAVLGVNDGVRAGEASANPAAPAGYQPLLAATGANGAFSNDQTEFAINGRVDFKVMGEWNQWGDFVAWSEDPMFLDIGGGVQYQKDDRSNNAAIGKDDFIIWTGDVLSKFNGIALYASGFGFTTLSGSNKGTAATPEADFNDFGVEAQASYQVIPDKLEPFVRFEDILPDDRHYAQGLSPSANADQVRIVTVGANYYLRKHNAKFTLDAMWSPDTISAQTTGGVTNAVYSGADFVGDTYNTSRNQVVIQAQFQLVF